jgi:hypothetical protein
MIHVSQKKLDKSYRHLKQEYKKNSPGSNAGLLLFVYAIESGVKALLLKRKNMIDTFKLQKNEGKRSLTHDLRFLLTTLHSPHRLPENFQFLTRSKNPETVSQTDLHQALRYGGVFLKPDEKNGLENKLEKIDSWLQEELA